jgi:hypothetical protein
MVALDVSELEEEKADEEDRKSVRSPSKSLPCD